jgi:hypothetical protein
MSSATGRPLNVTRIDTGGYGTFGDTVSPNVRIPMGESSAQGYTLSKPERDAILSALGQDFNQERMAASRFTALGPEAAAEAKTYSVFLPETGATGLSPQQPGPASRPYSTSLR